MDDATLARLEHENFIASGLVALGGVPGALIRRDGGVVTLLSGLPLLLFNQILIESSRADPGALQDAVEAARARGHRFVVDVRSGSDDHVIPEVGELGLVMLGDGPWIPGMAMYPLAVEPHDVGLDLRRVRDGAGIEDHVQAAAAGFEMSEDLLRRIVRPGILEAPGTTVFVGYHDGEPVATGLGIRTGRTIGVYNIATVPTARRRGFGRAMTAHVVAEGAAAGCDVAVLQASDMGRPIYERMGFRTVVEYLGFVEPTPDVTPEG